MDSGEVDICRVCRAEGSSDKPLFHPCMCTGSIKFVHQECLVQWLNHSKKEFCELCKHKFVFKPIYAPDMPHTLPISEFLYGLGKNLGKALQYWLHYTLVAIAWLGVVPLTSYRIYRCFFAGSVSSLLTLPLDILSTSNLLSDCLKGCFMVGCSICAFIVLVWLREQIVVHGGPDWLEAEAHPLHQMNLPRVARGWLGGVIGAGGVIAQENQEVQIDEDNAANVEEEPHNENEAAQVDHLELDGNEAVENEEPENENQAPADDWNPEWDRAAEDLTWERFLGLDGSLVFLEHVFWIISLNTSFILVFAFCPFHIGQFIFRALGLHFQETRSEFSSIITCLVGYFAEAVTLLLLHAVAGFFHLKKTRRLVGLCYVVIKVSLIMVVEVGIFPLICGWWIDICTLPLFGITLKDRQASFEYAPGTTTFLHWLVGMLYVFYFASFVILLREILRPGVLWFLRNLNDPDFHPMQEMIHLPVYRHVRRFALSLVVFGTAILIKLWLPVQLIELLFHNFLPFNLVLTSEIPVSELPLELLLLQVVLPALLEQAHTRQWIKNVVRLWVVSIAYLLDIRSYLLGDVSLDGVDPNMIHHQAPVNNNGHAHRANQNDQAQNNQGAPPGHIEPQPYIKPLKFPLRIICLLLFMSASMIVSSFVVLTLPGKMCAINLTMLTCILRTQMNAHNS